MRRAQGRSVWKGRGRWGWGRADTGPLLPEPRAACGRGRETVSPELSLGHRLAFEFPLGRGESAGPGVRAFVQDKNEQVELEAPSPSGTCGGSWRPCRLVGPEVTGMNEDGTRACGCGANLL